MLNANTAWMASGKAYASRWPSGVKPTSVRSRATRHWPWNRHPHCGATPVPSSGVKVTGALASAEKAKAPKASALAA